MRWSHSPWRWLLFKPSVIHFAREDHESMKPPSNVKTPAQYIASLPADRAKTIATVRAFVNKHIPRGYDECLVWGTIGWTIPLSRYPDTYNQQPICYVALSSQKNYCSLYLMGAFWSASQLEQLKAAFKAAGKKLDMGKCCVHFQSGRFAARSDWQADLGDFQREVDRDVRTIALDDQGGAGAEGEAKRLIGEQGGHHARRHKASPVDVPSITRRYRARKACSALFFSSFCCLGNGSAPQALPAMEHQ
jgi:hypothetical protein